MNKILYTKEEAIKEGMLCLTHNKNTKQTNSLINTMTYIFDVLHHSCYFLCVYKGVSQIKLFKLENKTSPLIFKKAFENNVRKGLFQKTLKPQQKQHIINTISNPFRVMQCIVKPIRDDSTFSKEYEDFLNNISAKLKSGVYILNLTDAVILRNDKMMPSPILSNISLKSLGIEEESFIPIFSLSGQKGYVDIPIPNYDDIKEIQYNDFELNWNKKREKAVFRGGPTGCGVIPETNSRLKLATIRNNTLLDVGLVSGSEFAQTIDTKSVRIDPKNGLGMLNTGIKPVKKMTMKQQSEHKYLIHVDGNVNAYRLLTTMLTGSLILRVESEYTSWLDTNRLIQPNEHYIPIKSDLSNLLSTIEWCKKNDATCEQIAKHCFNTALKIIHPKYIERIFVETVRGTTTSTSTTSTTSSKSKKSYTMKTGKRCPNGYRVDKKDGTKCRAIK